MLFSCCSSPKTCKHPKPTLQDWIALAYCYKRIYEREIDAVFTGVMMLILFALMMLFWAITPDPFYG